MRRSSGGNASTASSRMTASGTMSSVPNAAHTSPMISSVVVSSSEMPIVS